MSCCHAGSRRTAEAEEAGMQYGATKDSTACKSDLAADASKGSREGAQGAGAQTGVGARSQPNDLMAEFLYHEMVNHTATRHIVFAPGLDFDALVDLCMDSGGPFKPSGVVTAARTREDSQGLGHSHMQQDSDVGSWLQACLWKMLSCESDCMCQEVRCSAYFLWEGCWLCQHNRVLLGHCGGARPEPAIGQWVRLLTVCSGFGLQLVGPLGYTAR